MQGLIEFGGSGAMRFGILAFQTGVYGVWNGGYPLTGSRPFDTLWHFYALRWDGTTLSLFVDEAKFTINPAAPTGPVDVLAYGYQLSARSEIDAIGHWSTALSDEQLGEIYNDGDGWEYGLPPPPDAVLTVARGRVQVHGANVTEVLAGSI